MDNEMLKDDNLRNKAEELFQSRHDLIESESKDVDEVIYELSVNQIN
jgi:hypothetical protein